jgi:tagatose-1,6-bisphosphate aldolase
VEYERYVRQVEAACKAGASGIAVGRAVWQEAVTMMAQERIKFLSATARERLSRLTSLCNESAKPCTDFYAAEAPFDWYKNY